MKLRPTRNSKQAAPASEAIRRATEQTFSAAGKIKALAARNEQGKERVRSKRTLGISNKQMAALLRATLRREFAAFCHKAFPVVYPGQRIAENWHIDALCHHVQSMWEGDGAKYTVINVPPRSLKSFIVSVCWPAWMLGRDPGLSIIVASYSEDLGVKFSRECRRLMESRFYKQIFRGTRLFKSKEGELETTRNGCRLTASVGGTLTGRGADVLVIDDPMKADDAGSDVRREGVNDWFRNTAMSRLNQPKSSLVAVVMQRLHQDDLSGVLIGSGWDALVIPAIATEAKVYWTGPDDDYRREAGEVLQKEGPYSTDYTEQKRSLGSSIFSAQYQQDPLPSEGNAVKREWLRRYDVLPPRFDKIVVSVDPAAAIGPRNDYTAILVVGVKNGFFYVLSAERGRWGIEGIIDAIERAGREWKADLVLIENTSSGQSIIPLMKRSSRLDIKECNPDGNKLQRMSRHVGRIEAHRLLLPQEVPWLAEFEKELLAFPSASHDDQVDALVQFFEYYKDHEQFDNYDSVTVWGTFSNPWPDHMRIQRYGHSDNPFVVS